MFEMMLMHRVNKVGPQPGIWSALPVGDQRYDFPMVHYSGTIYVFGGARAGAALNSIRKYDLSSNTWTTLSAVLPQAVQGSTATVIGGLIYIFGGVSGNTKFGTLCTFNPKTNIVASLPAGTPCNGHIATEYDGNLYIFGGQPTDNTTPPLRLLRKYDVNSKQWSNVSTSGTTPKGRYYAAGGRIGNKLYIACGSEVDSVRVTGMDIYDFTTATWTSNSSGPSSIAPSYATLGGYLYVACGNELGGSAQGYRDKVRAFDPVQGTWTEVSNYPLSLGYAGGCSDGTNFYMLSGYTAISKPTAFNILTP